MFLLFLFIGSEKSESNRIDNDNGEDISNTNDANDASNTNVGNDDDDDNADDDVHSKEVDIEEDSDSDSDSDDDDDDEVKMILKNRQLMAMQNKAKSDIAHLSQYILANPGKGVRPPRGSRSPM